jgi:hypothetical protein
MNKVRVVVTVPNAKGDALQSVVGRLRDAGLDVEKVHDKLGLVTGSIAENEIDSLRKVEGVGYARKERDIHL